MEGRAAPVLPAAVPSPAFDPYASLADAFARLGYGYGVGEAYLAGANGGCQCPRNLAIRDRTSAHAFLRSDDGLIVEDANPHYAVGKSLDHAVKASKTVPFGSVLSGNKVAAVHPEMPTALGTKDYLFQMAKDQQGCRLLQQQFEEGKGEVDAVFDAVIGRIMELMVNPFGNYVVQKLVELCDEDQRLRIVVVLTEDPVKLVKVSVNTHGTRAVQKLIESLQSQHEIALVISGLRPGFLDLIKDLNGNHVIQKCLQSFSAENNKFIFDAAAFHCLEMAMHRHGCCVLQRCIANSHGENRAKLVTEVCASGLQLAQDPFGNYVVQYVIDLKIQAANANLALQFEGHYVYLSKQKVSSNVVEKCIKVFGEDEKARIIYEMLSAAEFEELLQDPYANYVIYTALQNTKGTLHNALVESIRPYSDALRTNPCCKRIFRAISRK